jgi:hypothetical protein
VNGVDPIERGGMDYLKALDAADDLPAIAHHLGYYLQARADNATGKVRPTSLTVMRRETRLGETAVIKYVGVLETARLLKVERAPKAAQQRQHEMNRYTLCIPRSLALKAGLRLEPYPATRGRATPQHGVGLPRHAGKATPPRGVRVLSKDSYGEAAPLADARRAQPSPALRATVAIRGGMGPNVPSRVIVSIPKQVSSAKPEAVWAGLDRFHGDGYERASRLDWCYDVEARDRDHAQRLRVNVEAQLRTLGVEVVQP